MVDEKSARDSPTSPWDFPLQTHDSWPRRLAKAAAGYLLAILRPDIARKLEAGAAPRNRIERLVLAGLVARYRSSGGMDRLMPQHSRYWEGESAVLFHAVTEARCRDEFHRVHGFVPDMLGRLTEATGLRSICEIGCGSGVVLAELGSALPQLRELIGLDLSAEQTGINRSRHRDPRLTFAHGDACQWIPRHARPGMIFMTYGGVFEYFAESAMRSLLQDIASLAPAALMLVEPIALDHDLERDFHSRPYGDELSLSHNYPRLLAQSGFTLLERRECTDGGLRWLAMTATIARSPGMHAGSAAQPPGV